MIDKLKKLKNTSEDLLKLQNSLKKIHSSITLPQKKTITTTVFWIIFFVIFALLASRYLFHPRSANYNYISLILGLSLASYFFTSIIRLIIAYPLSYTIKKLKLKKFKLNKPKIDSILGKVDEIDLSLNNYPKEIKGFLNSYYLDKLIEYLSTEKITIDEAISKLKTTEKNKKDSHKIKVAKIRINNINLLFKLSSDKEATSSYDNWLKKYMLQ